MESKSSVRMGSVVLDVVGVMVVLVGNDPSPTGAQEYGDPLPEGGPPENSINLISIANNLGSIDIIASMKTFVEIL